jgi:alanine racemase
MINLERMMGNFQKLRYLDPQNPFLCPMIKANAYGHGDIAIAKALIKVGCQFLGVSSVEEGLRLRDFNVDCDILVFGFDGIAAITELISENLTPVVSNFYQLDQLQLTAKTLVEIHLKFNTGMNRLGFKKDEIAKVKTMLDKNKNLKVVGLCTHLSSGETILEESGPSYQQLQNFSEICSLFPQGIEYIHAYNSSAMTILAKNKKTFKYGSRPGLLAYGIDPTENLSLKPLVSPVMEFKSKIVTTLEVKSGEVVSYAETWKAPKDSLIAIVPAGYGDGVSTSLSNRGEVLVCGQRAPIRGRVCMDYTMIDITEHKKSVDSFVGEEVVFFGEQKNDTLSLEEVSLASGRLTYELMTSISERVPRLYGGQFNG